MQAPRRSRNGFVLAFAAVLIAAQWLLGAGRPEGGACGVWRCLAPASVQAR
jgi:hypothetical protein